MTRWQQFRLRSYARQMIHLEHVALGCELRGELERAADLWQRREQVQWLRSLLLRDIWTHARSER